MIKNTDAIRTHAGAIVDWIIAGPGRHTVPDAIYEEAWKLKRELEQAEKTEKQKGTK